MGGVASVLDLLVYHAYHVVAVSERGDHCEQALEMDTTEELIL